MDCSRIWENHTGRKKNENLVFHCQDTLDFSAYIVKNYREIMAHKNIHFSSLKNAYDINGIALIIADGDWILDIEYPKIAFYY